LRSVQLRTPGTQEEAAERVDVAPPAAINRRTKDIGQPFGGKSQSADQPSKLEKCSQYLSRFSSAVEQRFCNSLVVVPTRFVLYQDIPDCWEFRAAMASVVSGNTATC
jgi:hypothetical protein